MLAHIHPSPFRFAYGPVSPEGLHSLALCPDAPSLETTKCPEPLCPIEALPRSRDLSCIASEGATPPSSLLRTHAPDPHPPSSSTSVSSGGSLQVVTSPCWMLALPDVVSACLSLDAWPHTPASPPVPLPVSSQRTPAFPPV